jgi:hypothetical protein
MLSTRIAALQTQIAGLNAVLADPDLPARDGLFAGGNWIRTFGSARDRLRFKALSLVGRLVVRRIEGADQ